MWHGNVIQKEPILTIGRNVLAPSGSVALLRIDSQFALTRAASTKEAASQKANQITTSPGISRNGQSLGSIQAAHAHPNSLAPMKRLNGFTITALFIVGLGLQLAANGQEYYFSTGVNGFLTMKATDKVTGASGSFSLNFTNITDYIYIDTTNQTMRHVGTLFYTPSAPSIVLSNGVGQFPNPPVAGTLTIYLAPSNSVLHFDTGAQPMTWNGSIGAYSCSGWIGDLGSFNGSYSEAIGGQTYNGSFNYVLNGQYPYYLYSVLSAVGYPCSITLSGLPASPGYYLLQPNPIADFTLTNGLHVQIELGGSGSSYPYTEEIFSPDLPSLATPTLLSPSNSPAITGQPQSVVVCAHDTASFSVTASGTIPLSYQWSLAGTNISGATGSSLTVTNVQPSQAGSYSVSVFNACGSVASSNALLTVLTPPTITSQPINQTVAAGGTVTFTVVASGSTPLNYQWFFGTSPAVVGTGSSPVFSNVQPSQAGSYLVIVSNACGSVSSSNALLTVYPGNPVHYVNFHNATPVSPFLTWATAANSIQDAILFANDGDTVLVTNGVYATGGQTASGGLIMNRVSIDRCITVQSLNGPGVTIIQGNGPLGDSAVRCAYLTNGAVLSGFTLTNGATRDSGDISTAIDTCGGGVLCESINALVTNCTLTGNSAGVTHEEWWSSWEGGNGAGAYGGTLNNCILTGNSAGGNGSSGIIGYGGGVYGATLTNCTLTGNYAGGTYNDLDGGG